MHARSYLFVPGDRPERFEKALASGADQVIIDLEDAVASADKAQARANIRAWLAQRATAPQVVLRINGVGEAGHNEDVALGRLVGVAALMVPKAQSVSGLAGVAQALPPETKIIALVESVAGLMRLPDLVRVPGVERVGFGSIDFCLDAGMRDELGALDAVRSRIVLESRYAGLAAPIDGVSTAIDDAQLLQQDVARARAFGFGAKLCIHPRQVAAVNSGLMPSEQEVDWARRVMAAVAGDARGALQVDGKLIDKPLIELAESILARSTTAA